MDMNKLLKILKLSESPEWATRSPDQQQIQKPETVAPIKQGGMPAVPGTPQPNKPSKMNPAALSKAADSLLLGNEPQGSSSPSGIPGQEGGGTSLSNALRMRRLARQGNTSMPSIGSVGYSSKGGY